MIPDIKAFFKPFITQTIIYYTFLFLKKLNNFLKNPKENNNLLQKKLTYYIK